MPRRQIESRRRGRRWWMQPTRLAPGALPEAWCKEDLSVAYAHAVATCVGVSCDALKRDINGWDVLFRGRDHGGRDALQLAAQLKCTVGRLARLSSGRELSFQLDAGAYDALRIQPTHPPRLLIVVEAPSSSPLRWVEMSPTRLVMNASAWWASLAGMPDLAEGQGSTAVRIPISSRFTPRSLLANMRSCP